MSLNYPRSNSRGLTLIEILVALVMTLIVLGAMMYAFRYASQEITRSRAIMEMSNQLLVVQDQLRADFDGVTVDLRPWAKSAGPNGYFEYVEGAASDKSYLDTDGDNFVDPTYVQGVMGDLDDMLAMTVRSKNRPFRGRFNGQIIESNVAEVIWWTTFFDIDADGVPDYNEPVTLHRRALLIRPDLLADLTPLAATTAIEIQQFYLLNDVSVRWADVDGDGNNESMVPNSLADLSKRENRFCHDVTAGYPFVLDRTLLASYEMNLNNMNFVNATTGVMVPGTPGAVPELPTQAGDDIMLTDLAAFDLQIFSPDTPVRATGGLVFEPDDVNYGNTVAADTVEFGAFVDLAYGRTPGGAYLPYDSNLPQFSTAPTPGRNIANVNLAYPFAVPTNVVYDTFSTHYESDGLDTDGDGAFDEGTDGVDNDGINGVDDNGERETLPPYPDRVLGMKATIRIIERSTQQIRQTEVTSSFVPQ